MARNPKGSTPIAITVYRVERNEWLISPLTTATTAHSGVTNAHRTMDFAFRSLRIMIGSSMAATTRSASRPEDVGGGNIRVHPRCEHQGEGQGAMHGEELVPQHCGRKNQAELIRAPLTATVTGVSYGARSVNAAC